MSFVKDIDEETYYQDYLVLEQHFCYPFPEEWEWEWKRWCIENCNSVGQCNWSKDNCPFCDLKLEIM